MGCIWRSLQIGTEFRAISIKLRLFHNQLKFLVVDLNGPSTARDKATVKNKNKGNICIYLEMTIKAAIDAASDTSLHSSGTQLFL